MQNVVLSKGEKSGMIEGDVHGRAGSHFACSQAGSSLLRCVATAWRWAKTTVAALCGYGQTTLSAMRSSAWEVAKSLSVLPPTLSKQFGLGS